MHEDGRRPGTFLEPRLRRRPSRLFLPLHVHLALLPPAPFPRTVQPVQEPGRADHGDPQRPGHPRPAVLRPDDRRPGREEDLPLRASSILIAATPLFHLVRDAGAFPLFLRALSGVGWGISMTATISVCSDFVAGREPGQVHGHHRRRGARRQRPRPARWPRRSSTGSVSAALFNAALLFLVASLVCILLARETPRTARRPAAQNRRFLRTRPVWALLIISAMPVFHGAVRGTMIYFIALFGKSIDIGRVGPFFRGLFPGRHPDPFRPGRPLGPPRP